MKVLGIEFAPLRIPLERRLQTFAVFYYCSSFIFVGIIGILICALLLFSSYYFIPLIYLPWLFYDHNICNQGGRRWEWFRRLRFWQYFRDYFPVKMVKTAELDPNRNYILCYHPHGIMCAGAFSCFATNATNFSEEFPGITPRVLTLEGQFWFPFHREHVLSIGACAATREGIEWVLTNEGTGNALVLIVGGAAESLEAHPGSISLVLKRRKGFVKLALKHGACLVPVLAFGENDLFNQVQNPDGSALRKIQNKLTKVLGFAPPLFHGRGMFQYNIGLLPFRKPITVVVGKPLDIGHIAEPTDEDIKRTHELYMQKLTELFEEYKPLYGPNLVLKIT